MPVLTYRGRGGGGSAFTMSPLEFLRLHASFERTNNPTYGWIIILVAIIILTVFLILAPNTVQPIATHIAIMVLLLLPMLFILRILYHCAKKKLITSRDHYSAGNYAQESASTYESLSNTASRRSSVFTVHMSPERHTERHTLDEIPPKYELPPSYSQATSMLSLNLIKSYPLN